MTQHLYLKLRLDPTPEQSVTLNKHFGCRRFVYNYYLSEKLNFYETRVKSVKHLSKDQHSVLQGYYTPVNLCVCDNTLVMHESICSKEQ